jgi:FMN phosphatase YigB (HAD superfamily)
MQAPIETLLFDFGGTLDADGVAWKERFYTLYCAEGFGMAAERFASRFFVADDSLIGKMSPATGLSGTVHALVANLEAELVRGAGADWAGGGAGPSNSDRGERVASRFLSDASAAFARNRPVLAALSQRYRLGVVSNFYGNLEAVCYGAGLGSFFATLIDSHSVGVQKPDPAIFRAALERLGAKPETTLFVGDSLRRDREGAHQAGMQFVWIAPEHIMSAEARAAVAIPVKHAVSELRDLIRLLT